MPYIPYTRNPTTLYPIPYILMPFTLHPIPLHLAPLYPTPCTQNQTPGRGGGPYVLRGSRRSNQRLGMRDCGRMGWGCALMSQGEEVPKRGGHQYARGSRSRHAAPRGPRTPRTTWVLPPPDTHNVLVFESQHSPLSDSFCPIKLFIQSGHTSNGKASVQKFEWPERLRFCSFPLRSETSRSSSRATHAPNDLGIATT